MTILYIILGIIVLGMIILVYSLCRIAAKSDAAIQEALMPEHYNCKCIMIRKESENDQT